MWHNLGTLLLAFGPVAVGTVLGAYAAKQADDEKRRSNRG